MIATATAPPSEMWVMLAVEASDPGTIRGELHRFTGVEFVSASPPPPATMLIQPAEDATNRKARRRWQAEERRRLRRKRP